MTGEALRLEQILKRDPSHIGALLGMSLLALAGRQTESAIRMASAAIVVAPKVGNAWVTLGQALLAANRQEEAEQAYLAAIRLDGMNAFARMGLGELKIGAGLPQEAMAHYELALRRDHALVPALLGMWAGSNGSL